MLTQYFIYIGSLLVASAQAGAYTLGSDIDFKLLHGLGINFIHQRKFSFSLCYCQFEYFTSKNLSESGRFFIKYGDCVYTIKYTESGRFLCLINCIITFRQWKSGKVMFSVLSVQCWVPRDHYPWCIGPHLTRTC